MKTTQQHSVQDSGLRREAGHAAGGNSTERTLTRLLLGGQKASSPISREWRSHTTPSTEGTAHEIWILLYGTCTERLFACPCAGTADGPGAATSWVAHRHQDSAPYARRRLISFSTRSVCACICNATSARISACSVESGDGWAGDDSTGNAGWRNGQVERSARVLTICAVASSITSPTVEEKMIFILSISRPLPCSLRGWLVGWRRFMMFPKCIGQFDQRAISRVTNMPICELGKP